MKLDNDFTEARSVMNFPYANLPKKIKCLNKRSLNLVFFGYEDPEDYEKAELSKEGVKFLREWYWLMKDIHEGKAFNYGKFNMGTWLEFDATSNLKASEQPEAPVDQHFCGTVACALGYAQVANIIPDRKLEFIMNKDNKGSEGYLVVKNNEGDIVEGGSGNEMELEIGDYFPDEILPEDVIGFIVSPYEYYDEDKLREFFEDNFFKRFNLAMKTKDKYGELPEVADLCPIEPGDVAERIEAILEFAGENVGKPNPRRHWLNKNFAIQPKFVAKRTYNKVAEKVEELH